jgi:O-antigen/teichoic acid export membrane protein
VQAFSLVAGIIVARSFGANGYGQLSYAMALVAYFMLATDFGVTSIAIRDMAKERDRWSSILTTYIVVRAIMSLMAYTGIVLVTIFSHQEGITRLLVLTYALQMFVLVASVSWIFVAHQKMQYDGFIKTTQGCLYAVLLVGLLAVWHNILVVPLATFIAALVVTPLGWHLMRGQLGRFRFVFDRRYAKELLLYSWPVGISNGATQITVNMAAIFITLYHGNAMTGVYSSAYRIVSAMIMFATFFTSALYPLICEKAVGPRESLQRVLEVGTRLLLLLTVPIGVVLTILGPRILVLVFGREFGEGGIALQVLGWSIAFLVISRMYGNALVAISEQRLFTVIVVVSAGLNVGLSVLLIPRYGIIGASLASCMTEAFNFLASCLVLRRRYVFSVLRPFVLSLFCAAIMGLSLYVMRSINLAFLLLAAPFLYLLPSYLSRSIKNSEVTFAWRLAKQIIPVG